MSLGRQAGIILPGYDPLRVANPPVIGTASSASGTSVSVSFTAPSCTGGAAITSYTAYACCGIRTATGASSPLVVTGLTTGQSYVFRVFANNLYGPSYPSGASNSVVPLVQGQQAYTTPGTYTWIAPAGVTSVSVVAVGAGGSGGSATGAGPYPRGGGGGGLGYKNNISVTPGNSYTVFVGNRNSAGSSGQNSYFINLSTVAGLGGGYSSGGSYVGDGGGSGGNGSGGCGLISGGGGGAGGYSGNGGRAGNYSDTGTMCTSNPFTTVLSSQPGSGGGGGGGAQIGSSFVSGVASGGGVGILGQGSNGAAAVPTRTNPGGYPGISWTVAGGGSGGSNGTTSSSLGQSGGLYGGGGSSAYGGTSASGGLGGTGAVRIIWPGTTRQFPSTNTGDL